MTIDAAPPPTREAVSATLRELVARELGAEVQVPGQADLAEHLDSVQRLTLVVAIEDHFEICFEPEDDDQVNTLDQAVDAVVRLLGAPVEGAGA